MKQHEPELSPEIEEQITNALLGDTFEKYGGRSPLLSDEALVAYALNLRELREWQHTEQQTSL